VLCFGCILDPQFKFNFLRFCYAKLGLDQMAIQAKLKVVKHKLYTLYNEYVKLFSKEATCNATSSQTSSRRTSSVTTFTSENSSSQWNVMNVSLCSSLFFLL